MKRIQVKSSPRTNKILLVTNIILFFGALVLAVLHVDVKEYTSAAALVFVTILTGVNIFGCWKRLQNQ